ncbi:MAG: replicative DNA helicase [Deltaproteobacteria bacterium]|nr:replicative DNA helicase [Deltaproteobacteria bacterium]
MRTENNPPSQILPHDKEAEQGVLGAVIHNNQALYQVMDLLSAESFFAPAHRHMFQAMLEMAEMKTPIDEITLANHLRSKNLLENVGGLVYIAEMTDLTPVTSNITAYAEIVREKYQLRSLINNAMEIATKGRQSPEDVGGLIQTAEGIFQELATSATRRSYSHIRDLLGASFEAIEKQQDMGGSLTGLPTGFTELDEMTSGMQPSDLIILAARPSMGKTSFAMNIAKHSSLATGKAALVFSLEMSKEQLTIRLLCSEAKVDSQKLRVGNLDEYEWEKLAAAAGRLAEANIYLDDTPEVTPMAMKAIARRVKSEAGLGLVVVDYLQLMRTHRRTDNREQEIADISRGLKALAKELEVPVLACAQLNRSLESRADKRPVLSDLRESGSIEQDADLVVFIYRDEVYNKETEDAGIAEILVSKHRNGPIGVRRLAFIPQFTMFANLSLRQNEDGPAAHGPPS